MHELQSLLDLDVAIDNGRILISDRAHIVFDFHQEIDGMLEQLKDDQSSKAKAKDANGNGNALNGSIGTTRRGIGPTYASKCFRNGLRFGDLRDWDGFKEKYLRLVEMNQLLFDGLSDYNAKEELQRFESYRELLMPMIADTVLFVNDEYRKGKRILMEGANAAMLDLDFGTYPMVTASSTCHGGISTGMGLAAPFVDSRIGVVKAYTTRVGHGPFPTELTDEMGQHLQEKGFEFGTTTGRRRRCGWLDVPLLRYSHLLNAYSSMNVTKLDVLSECAEVCIGTEYKVNGAVLPRGAMPSTMEELAQIEVQYETLPGWQCDISEVREYADLPTNARAYVERVEQLTDIPVSWIGVGPDRKDMVLKK